MRRKIAITLMLLMTFNLLVGGLGDLHAYGQDPIPVIPEIIRVDFKEIVEVDNKGNKVTKSVVVFNGKDLGKVKEIVVHEKVGEDLHARKVLAPFTIIRSNEIHYIPTTEGQTPKDIFGLQKASGTGEVRFSIITEAGEYPIGATIFNIPLESQMMRVDTVNGLSHYNWPITVIQEPNGFFTIEGSNFNPDDFELSVSKGDFASVTSYEIIDGDSNRVKVDIEKAPHGSNQNLIFKKDSGTNVAVYYTVKNAVSIVRPLNLGGEGEVNITPLQGTKGTIVRITAKNHHYFNDTALKVYIGGIEAKRNVSAFNKNGIFEYQEEGEKKIGLEVIVPNLGTFPQENLPIEITLDGGDTYVHSKRFKYFPVSETRLQVMDVDPEEGFTNTNNIIHLLRLRNAIEVKNIPDEYQLQYIKEGDQYKIQMGKYSSDIKMFEEDGRAIYIKYQLADNQFIERKISIDIGLPADINSVTNQEEIKKDLFNTGNPYFENFRLTTGQVHDAGPQPIYVRTETILYKEDGSPKPKQQYYVVEEAPYPGDTKVVYSFKPDQNAPQIQNITPSKGPHDKDITATITGSNFRVESVGQNKYYPTLIIGSEVLGYKVIKKDGVYLSNNGDGTALGEAVANFDFVVLDNQGNIIDGEARKIGTQIKFTIPAGEAKDFEGIWNATVTVYNPNPSGGLGGRSTWNNFFQYIFPDAGVLLPQITSVAPDKVAVGSKERIIVRGRYFQSETMVTLDGEVIPKPEIDVARGTITFNAPTGRPGKTKLQVINPDGGFDSHPFEYIRTFTQPYIDKVIPNFGGMGSLVIIKGNHFYPADPNGQNQDYKIGTRVYIDNKDINNNNVYDNLQLKDFKNPFDTEATAPAILGPDGESIKTYGSHVAVVDHETIYIIVPNPEGEKTFPTNKWLELKVVNPDLGSYTVKNGFKILNVAKNPEIESISPNLGDYRGGNIAEITGDYFLENVKVYFGTQEAKVYRRRNNGTALWVYVPAYGEELKAKNRAKVPVTVQNSDGSSVTKYDGYNYVNPGYDAKITKISPNAGNTAGGERILLSGENFRAVTGAVYQGGIEKPAVYFGGIKVDPKDITFVLPPKGTLEPVEITDLIIVEKTPSNPAGKVDVTVINYDGATATLKNGFEYHTKKPAITQVLPSQGNVYGGDEVTIIGKDFVERGLYVTFDEEEQKRDVLSGQATVTLGDIVVHYNAYAPVDNIQLYYKQMQEGNELKVHVEGKQGRVSGFHILEEEEFKIVRVPWKSIGEDFNEETIKHLADENIKIEVKDNNLIVTRRLGIVQKVEGDGRITIKTPPAASIGKKVLTVYNFDGAKATSSFTYTSPYRPPVITNIIPTSDVKVVDVEGIPEDISLATASPKGGSPLIIEGKNFRAGVKVFIGDQPAEIRSRSLNDDELIITVPPAATGAVGPYLRILIVNEDGGMGYGDVVPVGSNRRPYYFKYIIEGSSPVISLVNPNKGPTSGGTKITIKGNEFKNEDSLGAKKDVAVFIGGIPVPQIDVTYIDYNTLEVTVPSGKMGVQTVEVVNYDYGRAIGTDGFTYISQPKVLSVNPAKLFSNDIHTEVTITGKMFLPGARVVLGGEVIKEEDIKAGMEVRGTGINGVEDGTNKNVAVIGGIEATSVQVENVETLKVKFPEAFDLKNNHIIIINPDGGVSDPYKDFNYQIPIPTKPLVLEAIPGFESTVQLIWSDSDPEVLNAAEKYEIYGKKSSDKSYSFIGDTQGAEFLVRGLEPSTRYDFMVRALNRYGSALEFAEATVRTLSPGEDDKLKDKLEELEKAEDKLKKEGKEEVVEGVLVKTIGTEQIATGTSTYTIDFSLSKYSNHNKFIVAIPVSLLSSLNRSIAITDGKANFSFSPKNLYTREVIQGAVGNLEDAYVRIVFERMTGQEAEGLSSALPRNQRRASNAYNIDFHLQVGKNSTVIRRMLQNGSLSITFDAKAYPNVDSNKLFIGKYDPSKHQFIRQGSGSVGSLQEPAKFMLLADR